MKSMKNLAGQSSSSFKNSWKLWHVFVVSFASADEDEAPTTSASKQTTKCHIFFQEFLQGFVKFSKLCQWFHVAKCDSGLNKEELSLKQLPLKFFGNVRTICYCYDITYLCSRITYQTISKLTFFMKLLHFSLLNNILLHEINEKPCWTELFFI